MDLQFTRSARKHKVGRERARQAMRNAVFVAEVPSEGTARKLLWLGADDSGRALEAVTVQDDPADPVVVIHVMDLRDKYRSLYEQGLADREQR